MMNQCWKVRTSCIRISGKEKINIKVGLKMAKIEIAMLGIILRDRKRSNVGQRPDQDKRYHRSD